MVWSGTRVLTIVGPDSRQNVLKLRAWILDRERDQIGWILICGEEEFGGAFTTAWNEDPLPAVEERFGRFADSMPHLLVELPGYGQTS